MSIILEWVLGKKSCESGNGMEAVEDFFFWARGPHLYTHICAIQSAKTLLWR